MNGCIVSALWLLNSVAMILEKSLCGHMFSFLLCTLGVELLDHMVNLCLMFQETTQLFAKMAPSFYIPTDII